VDVKGEIEDDFVERRRDRLIAGYSKVAHHVMTIRHDVLVCGTARTAGMLGPKPSQTRSLQDSFSALDNAKQGLNMHSK
jgi:hypothetical protein